MKTGLFFALIYVLVISCKNVTAIFSGPLISIPQTGNHVTAGQHASFDLTSTTVQISTCSFTPVYSDSTADSSDISLIGTDEMGNVVDLNLPFSLSLNTPKTVNVILTTTLDSDSTETVKFKFSCSTTQNVFPDLFVEFTIDPVTNAGGDPHFMQMISDKLSNLLYSICYDVQGESGQVIHIFTDSHSQLTVDGQLKDDYYLHKIFIQYRQFSFEITTKQIRTNLMKMLDWDHVTIDMWSVSQAFLIKRNANYLEIGEKTGDNLSVAIYRRTNKFTGEMYLDISIIGLTTNYTGQGGLIGRIGRNEMHIYDSVQDDEFNSARTIEVNGKRCKGRLENRSGQDCILMELKDALYPYQVANYVEF